MIGTSNIRPPEYEINILSNGKTEVLFYTNILESSINSETGSEQPQFTFDFVETLIDSRDGLEEDIIEHYDQWVSFAKGLSSKPLSDKELIIQLQNELRAVQADNVTTMTMLVEGGIL